ncbi:hypothetical protein MM_1338 [Methanosarcina mazei Go1]|uniref:DUF7507 domain-containing protein n=2 Tax=Methanosarcina mazei TaxID=2209 RepID=Q8PX84_METMA|nr:hypothetical protein MM_1338 [Methanosarcina mazei Go1]
MSNATPFVQVASAAAGDFSIDFIAAAPESYNHLTGGGAYDNRTIGVGKDVVESLQGGDFSCGDIVTFFALVTVDDTPKADNDEPQTIEMNFSFTADTTGQSGAAFGDIVSVGVNYGAVEDLIPGENTIDDGIIDDGGSVATLTSEALIGPLFQKSSELQGTVELTDLEAGEQVVVRIDVKLFCDPRSRPTGNLQAAVEDAYLTFIKGSIPATGDISVGQQTIPLKQINNLHNPDLKIQKTVNTTDGICPGVETLTVTMGDMVKYCFIVSNPGDAPLYNLKVVDDAGTPSNTADDFTVTLSSGLTDEDNDGFADDLAAGATATGTALVTLSKVGIIVNNATATGDDSIIEPTKLNDHDIATVIVEGTPSYTIDKTVERVTNPDNSPDADGIVDEVGDIIHYKIAVSNKGSVPLTNVTVTDPLLGTLNGPTGDNAPVNILNAGESWVFTGNYTVTKADLQSNATLEPDNIQEGFIDNKVTVTTTELPAPQEDSAAVPIQQNAAYTIEKIVTDVAGNGVEANVTKAGDVISYQITVNNNGNIDLTNVTLVDTLIPEANITGPAGDYPVEGVLEVGETWIFTGNYTITQTDINTNGGGDGFIENTATVDSEELPPESDSATVPIQQNAAYTIDKKAIGVDEEGDGIINNTGEVIEYKITVNNTGNIDLTNVNVTDTLIENLTGPTGDNEPLNILNVGETWTYTGTYTVTQQDINNNGDGDGDIDNTATVECDQLEPKQDSEEVPIQQNASYTIDKMVTDVAGNGPTANVTKTGDVISYQINVTNTGNIDLTNVNVTDTLIETLTGPVESMTSNRVLEVGETWTYTGTYTATLIDVITNGDGDGFIENTATVDSDQLGPESDSAVVPIKIIPVYEPNQAYEIEKSIMDVDSRGPAASVKEAGDVITYSIVVTNTGDVDLTNVVVTDSLIDLAGPVESENKDSVLEVGETWTFTGMYTVTQQDIDTDGGYDGYIDNVAMVDCDQLDPKSDSVRAPIEEAPVFKPCPAYEIEKCVTDVDCRGPTASVTEAGDVITYRITVVNTGNIDLTNVAVIDPLIKTLRGPVESKNVNGILDVGEIWTYTGSYKVTQEDMEINGECDRNINNVALVGCDSDTISKCYGYIDNVATVDCDQLGPKSDSVRVIIEKASTKEDSAEEDPIEKKHDYCIYKSIIGADEAGDCVINKAGDIIEYQILVKNEGNANLTGVSVSDPMITLAGPIGDDVDPGVLNPGEAWKFLGNYTVTSEDINTNGGGDGFIENKATVTCNELPEESSSVKQMIKLSSNQEDNGGSDENKGNGGDNDSKDDTKKGGNGGSARVIPRTSTRPDDVNGNKEKETGNIELEPDIKSFEQKDGYIEAGIEKEPEKKENTGIPEFLIYGIIGLLAILLLVHLYKRK